MSGISTRALHVLGHRLSIIGLCALLITSTLVGVAIVSASSAPISTRTATFTLDGVSVTVHTPFLPASFQTPKPGNVSQVALATRSNPFQELSVTTAPYGSHPITEQVQTAQPGGAAAYRNALRSYRANQGGKPTSGPTATLFGQRVTGIVSLVHLSLGAATQPVAIVEWVGEAGGRLWIARASKQLAKGATISAATTWLKSFSALTITAQSLSARTTATTRSSLSISTTPHQPTQTSCDANHPLCSPVWWNGTTCDTAHTPGSVPYTGADWEGLIACGPDHGISDNLVQYGGFGAYEWTCVELVMRYMYLAFGIPTFHLTGNAATLIDDYKNTYPNGGPLLPVSNQSSQTIPGPGDIIVANGPSSEGHTAVVIRSQVTNFTTGNGWVEVLEENNAHQTAGVDTYSMTNWRVDHYVTGWLHAPDTITLYDSTNYGGASVSYAVSGYVDLTNTFNDRTTSIRIPPGFAVQVWQNSNGTSGSGATATLYQSVPDLSTVMFNNTNIPVNDNISGIYIFQSSSCQQTATAKRKTASSCPPPKPPPPCTDSAGFVADVTYPDGSTVNENQTFTKTWRLRNTGTCTWSGYSLAFESGERMGGPSSVPVATTAPGQTVDISVQLTAPSTTGSPQGNWQLLDSQGVYVSYGNVWVQVNVAAAPSGGGGGDLSFTSVSYPTVVSPGQQFLPQITVTLNQGQLLESRGDMLRNVDNNLYGAYPFVAVVGTVNPGQSYTFTFYPDHPITAPSTEGDYQSVWKIWEDGAWDGPQLIIAFTVKNGGGTRPAAPTPTSPGNWYESRDGSTPQLCASSSDSNVQYDFQIYNSAQTPDSGWINSSCWTPPTLGDYTFEWHVEVRDNVSQLVSDWSVSWNFTVDSQQLTMDPITFDPASPSAADGSVQVRSCVQGFGNVNLGLSYEVNTATDGSANGVWHGFANGGNNCPDPNNPSTWGSMPSRDYADGDHLVRAIGYGPQGQTMDVYAVYHFNHRRPQGVQLLSPINGVRINTDAVTFTWRPSVNAYSYQLVISPNADMSQPLFNQNVGAATSYQYTFSQNYSPVYWQVYAINDLGSTNTITSFGIDQVAPVASVTALPSTSTDTTFTITWSGTDSDAGVEWYNVQYRDGNDASAVWTDWQINTHLTSALFTGQPGHSYYFRAQAMDYATNLSAYASGDGDTHTTIDLNARPPTPWWNGAYTGKRDVVILNNDLNALPSGYPIHLHFDSGTSPSASDIYNASLAATKGDDVRLVYLDTTELPRYIASFTSTNVDIWFNLQASIGPNPTTDSTSYQLYYGDASATTPPGTINDVIPEGTDANTLGLWHLQEGSGTSISDSSGNGQNGTASHMGWTTGKFGPAGIFANSNQAVVDLGPSTSFNTPYSLTLEAWVNPTDVGGEQSIFRKQADDGSLIYDFQVQGQVWLRLNGNEGNAHGATTLQPGRWYFIAGTYDGSTIRVYLNGVLDGSASYSKPLRYGTSTHLYLGGDGQNNNKYFDGLIQNARISNTVRSSFPYAVFANTLSEPSTGAGSPVSPPQQGAPSLAIQDVTVYSGTGGASTIAVTVQNQGNLATGNGFATDLYLNHVPTGPGDTTGSINSWVASPINSGQGINVATTITPPASATATKQGRKTSGPVDTTTTYYVQADATGSLAAYDQTSQTILGPILVCTTTPDGYESDGAPASASTIATDGTPQTHNIDLSGDQDWVKFTATAGIAYDITTAGLGPNASTALALYDTDGVTLLGLSDSYGASLTSQIVWQAPASGVYYLQVTNSSPYVGGCGTIYTLTAGQVASLTQTAKPGACSETVTVAAYNFTPGEMVNVYLDSTTAAALASAQADSSGHMTITVTLSRQQEATQHALIAVGQSSFVTAITYLADQRLLPSTACHT